MVRVLMLLAHGPGQPEGDLTHRLEALVALTPLAAIPLVPARDEQRA